MNPFPASLKPVLLLMVAVVLAIAAGCSRADKTQVSAAVAKHEHHPPHGGTPVVLGDEAYHIELVRDAAEGTLSAYVLDGEMEDFIRSAVPSVQIDAMVDGKPETLILAAVANPATGETVGDTALFQAKADWLRTTADFDGVLKSITIRGTSFTDVKFNFPKGNDLD